MKNSYLTKISLICLLCLSTAINGCCCINIGDWYRAKYERTDQLDAPFAPGSTFVVNNEVGSITAKGMNVTHCNVTATITAKAPTEQEAKELADRVKIELKQVERNLIVKIEKPRATKNHSISISFDITVPEQTALELGCDVGEIKISNITEKIKAQTDVGKITCRQISDDIEIISNVGSIEVVYSKTAPADCNATVSTDVGSIEITTPPDFSATVHARTDVGSIKTDLPLTIRGMIGHNLDGTIGKGEGELNLKTDVGSITIK